MITDSTLTIEADLYDTTSASSSGGFMNYKIGNSSASITCNHKFKDDTYGYENWNLKAQNKLICELWNYGKTAVTDYGNCYMKWMDTDGTNATTCYDVQDIWGRFKWRSYDSSPILTPQQRLREILQKRQSPLIIVSSKTVAHTSDMREIRARETLKRVLGDDKFKSFITRGFVSVRAKSGLIYQIFPSHGVTSVYRDGEMVERLCVVLRGEFPPTDSLIMRYLLILNDERDFRKHAIKHTIIQKKAAPVVEDLKPLTEIWKGLKVA